MFTGVLVVSFTINLLKILNILRDGKAWLDEFSDLTYTSPQEIRILANQASRMQSLDFQSLEILETIDIT
jgi:hypothetical protein